MSQIIRKIELSHCRFGDIVMKTSRLRVLISEATVLHVFHGKPIFKFVPHLWVHINAFSEASVWLLISLISDHTYFTDVIYQPKPPAIRFLLSPNDMFFVILYVLKYLYIKYIYSQCSSAFPTGPRSPRTSRIMTVMGTVSSHTEKHMQFWSPVSVFQQTRLNVSCDCVTVMAMDSCPMTSSSTSTSE